MFKNTCTHNGICSLSFTSGGGKEGYRPNNYLTILISLISKSVEIFDRADTVKADTLLCLRSRTDNFSLLADTLSADTFSTSMQVS